MRNRTFDLQPFTGQRLLDYEAEARRADDLYNTFVKLGETQPPQSPKSHLEIPYSEYLKSDHWLAKRQQKIRELGRMYCQLNNQHRGPFDIHHNTYANLGDEPMEDLICLCRGCHQKHHGRR